MIPVRQRTMAQIEAGLGEVRRSPRGVGTLALVVRRPRVDAREVLAEGELDPHAGLVGDSWRQRPSSRTPDGTPHPDMQLNVINARFANADAAKLRQNLIDQICEATGGPCKYSGKDMKTAHAGMNITEDEFTALVEDLVKSLDKAGVPQAEKDELLGALGGMKGDIVGQ